MNTFSQSVTFAPFVKGMPAFLQALYSAIFGADCTQYHVILTLTLTLTVKGRESSLINWQAQQSDLSL